MEWIDIIHNVLIVVLFVLVGINWARLTQLGA